MATVVKTLRALQRDTPSVSKPRFSVIVPVRNDAHNLRACLSALKQSTYPDYEIIVIDDASTDETREVIRQMDVRTLRMEQRCGPAAARNCGAVVAKGDYLLFVDADVCVTPHTLEQFANAFRNSPDVSAVFGSYDTHPKAQNVLSQYRNLLHHYVHQHGNHDASTFWAGCGAIKRAVFLELGGFDTVYRKPRVEDIELGVRLRNAGHKIQLNKTIQVTHLKHWSFWGILKTDIFDRAVPWSQLILHSRNLPNDLNLKRGQRLSAALAWGLLLVLAVAAWFNPLVWLVPPVVAGVILTIDYWSTTRRVPTLARWLATLGMIGISTGLVILLGRWVVIPAIMLIVLLLLNSRLLRFLTQARQPLFAVFAIPMLVLYYLYSSGAFAICVVADFVQRIRLALVRPFRDETDSFACQSASGTALMSSGQINARGHITPNTEKPKNSLQSVSRNRQ